MVYRWLPRPKSHLKFVYCIRVYCVFPFFKIHVPWHTSQVNADVVDMVCLSDGQSVKFGGSTKSVGRFISTKAVGSDERRDITHQYKYPEGSGYTNTHTGFNPNTAHLNDLHLLLLLHVRGHAYIVVCSCLYLSCSPSASAALCPKMTFWGN